jgi:uncharacterized damage-inducible protein DinB
MRKADIAVLFDHMYWANRKVLDRAAEVTIEQFIAPSSITTRNLRGTLVHELDVEWSWRLRLQGEPPEKWGEEAVLLEDDYPTVASLAEHWRRDEEEMRAWLASLDDEALARTLDRDGNSRVPLWYFLLHIVMHAAQQRSDAAVLLTNFGRSPGELEFLEYADWAHQTSGS